MPNIEIYTKDWCPYCARAKQDLDAMGVLYREIDVTADPVGEAQMISRAQRSSVPQIFVDGYHLGGSDDLEAAERSGLLDRLLAGEAGAIEA